MDTTKMYLLNNCFVLIVLIKELPHEEDTGQNHYYKKTHQKLLA